MKIRVKIGKAKEIILYKTMPTFILIKLKEGKSLWFNTIIFSVKSI